MSSNRTERSIKPFVMGRKNWLFSNTPAGAQSSAVIYSLIETAKENDLDLLTAILFGFSTMHLNRAKRMRIGRNFSSL